MVSKVKVGTLALAIIVLLAATSTAVAQSFVDVRIVVPEKMEVQQGEVFKLPISYDVAGDVEALLISLKARVPVDSFDLVVVEHDCEELETAKEPGHMVVVCKYVKKYPSSDVIAELVLKAKKTGYVTVEWTATAYVEDASYTFTGSEAAYIVVEKPFKKSFTAQIPPVAVAIAELAAMGVSQLLPPQYKHILLTLGILLVVVGVIAFLGLVPL